MKTSRLVCMLVVLAGFVVLPAGVASACDLYTGHCYGETYMHVSAIDGAAAQITPSCLGAPAGNFATDELWLANMAVSEWVEVGYTYNERPLDQFPDLPHGVVGFWADQRGPNDYHEHVMLTNPPVIERQGEIKKTGSGTYLVALGGASNGTSTSNPMIPYYGIYGAEVTADSGVHNSADFNNMVYHESGNWSTRLYNPTDAVGPPNVLSWINKPIEMVAGAPC